MPALPSAFDAATAVQPIGAGRWSAEVTDGWDVGGVANGGYVLSVAGRVLAAATEQPDPLTTTAHYLAPIVVGPLEIAVEVVRAGGRHATAVAALHQGGREVARVLGTLTDLAGAHGPERVTVAPPDLPPPEECMPAEPAEGFTPPAIAQRVSLRLDPRHVGFAVGAPTGRAEVAGWARFADGREPDTLALLTIADALPPPVFNSGLPLAWVPTVELTVHARARPAPGWLRCVFHSRVISGGYLEEDGEIWDADGRLVAQSRQLALVPRPR